MTRFLLATASLLVLQSAHAEGFDDTGGFIEVPPPPPITEPVLKDDRGAAIPGTQGMDFNRGAPPPPAPQSTAAPKTPPPPLNYSDTIKEAQKREEEYIDDEAPQSKSPFTGDSLVNVDPEKKEEKKETPPPAPAPQSSESPAQASTTKKYDPRIPRYQQERPNTALQVSGSMKAFSDSNQTDATKLANFQILFEWQPEALQAAGVFGIGLNANIYLGVGLDSVSPPSIYSGGAQVRYQMRYFREQPIVPMASYVGQYMSYKFGGGGSGTMLMHGPVLGAMILLNFFDQQTASEFYVEQGVNRSYLVAEYSLMKGDDGNLSVTGKSLFFGLRFEY